MENIIRKIGNEKGKTLAILCGVHGNELAGQLAVKKAIEEIQIKRGIVYFIFANPKAIEKNVRCIEKNLNRCFVKNQNGDSYEEKRAIEIMKILDECDASLDLHSSNNPNTIPFVITDNGFDVVKNMNFEIIAKGFNNVEPHGTDEYMYSLNKVGICLECGYAKDGEKNLDVAYDSIIQFLQYYDAIDKIKEPNKVKQKILNVDEVQFVTDESFELVRNFDDFETLPKGTLIAKNNFKEYKTENERVILFGIKKSTVGTEAYLLGNWIN